ncbi:MAG TPA: GNAT family N-acetyltransferase, partial [Patescibacteria group bacterium]|nr:GNAT family N-acetyltransferase [Patescibacteria group bacterium]
AFRGRGIANLLMQSAITAAKEKGVSYIDLTAKPEREEGNGLYEKFGFEKRNTSVYRLAFDYGKH